MDLAFWIISGITVLGALLAVTLRNLVHCVLSLILFFLGGWSVWLDYDIATENDYTMWTVPWIHWQVGGAFVIAVGAAIVGVLCFLYCRFNDPSFFKKQTLTRATATLVPDD